MQALQIKLTNNFQYHQSQNREFRLIEHPHKQMYKTSIYLALLVLVH